MTDQQLQDYASGKLPPEEAEAIAQAVAGDPALARKVAAYEKIFAALRRERLDEIEEELEEFIEELPVPGEEKEVKETVAKVVPLTPKPRWGRYWGLAAGVAAVVLLAVIFWPTRDGRAEVVAQFFELPEDESTASVSNNAISLLELAEGHFFGGRYPEAKELFLQLRDSVENRSEALYYLPYVYHLNGELEAADRAFAEALAITGYSPERREELRWNAMLNDLARGVDIEDQLAEQWSSDYRIEELRAGVKELNH